MSYRTANYSDYINSISALIGIEVADIQASELTILNAHFNRAIRKVWESNNWLDICPYGEARFPTNLIDYSNDYTQTVWTDTNITITANSIQNPLDIRVNCQKLLETVSNGTHGVSQSVAFIPNFAYQFSFYIRPIGRNYAYLSVNDGGATWTGFFNISTGVIGTASAGCQIATQALPNGFYLCSMTFTSAATAGSGSISIQTSPDGVTTSFAGSTSAGIYLWGVAGSQNTYPAPGNFYVPYTQDGETAIDVVFDAWNTNPSGFLPGYRSAYQLTQYGIQLIGVSTAQPIYLYYRPQRPIFAGGLYSSLTTYAIGSTFYYTANSGNSNYYSVIATMGAGQTPDSNPSLFSAILIPYVFFPFCLYNSYADWLQVEGQTAKSVQMYQYAQSCIDDEADKQERQQGFVQPMKVFTHVTSQNRGLGLVGQSNQPGFLNGQGYGY
jgi:hypothetical protein